MKIAIYGHYFNEDAKQYVEDLLDALKEKNTEIFIEDDFLKLIKTYTSIKEDYPTFSSYDDLDSSFNFFFTLGGDGTILRSLKYIRNSNIPVIGVNIGRLGFLATVQKEKIREAVSSLQNNEFEIKQRSLLSVITKPENGKIENLPYALNEITLSRKDTAAMITVETYLNGEYLTSYWADGLIIATPTGSTGYSLSCGGPVITPQAKSFALTPVAPHNLNARPLIIPDDTHIRMRIVGRENDCFLSLDSRIETISKGTEIHVEKAPFNLKMIELKGNSFIQTIRKKLLWGEDTRNK